MPIMVAMNPDSPFFRLELCAKSEEFTDEQVMEVFLDTTITSKEDVDRAVAILDNYRPKLASRMAENLLGLRPAD